MGRGEPSVAGAHLDAALTFGLQASWLEMILPARWGLAEHLLLAGDTAASLRECEAALSEAMVKGERQLLVPFVVTGVRAYLAAGRPEEAVRWLQRVERAIGPASTIAPPALHHGARGGDRGLGYPRADVGGPMGPTRRRIGPASREPIRRGDADVGGRPRGGPPSREHPVADARRRDPALGPGARRRAPAWYPLTIREFEVARHIANGLTNAQIAEQLGVSPKTISAHVEHILAKLGVGRRTEIAGWVVGVLPPDRQRSAVEVEVARA